MNKRVLAIIPARGGSKGILGKNIKPFAGKPLFWYSADAARKAGVRNIFITTDDPKISAAASGCNAKVIVRPKELATDSTPMLPVVTHAIDVFLQNNGYLPEIILLLQPTSPLRNHRHIKQALALLEKSKADSVVSVALLKKPVEWVLRMDKKGLLSDYSEKRVTSRQQAEVLYYPNGAIFASYTKSVLEHNSLKGPKTIGYVMPEECSIDIDSPLDFFVAENIMKMKNGTAGKKENAQIISVNGLKIGEGHPCFIIAEAGVNHNGSLRLAKKLVDVAKSAGADAVKFQMFSADRLVTRNAAKAEYQKNNAGSRESQYDMLKKLEMGRKGHISLKAYCRKKGVLFLSTPHSGSEDVDFLFSLGIGAFKISSADVTNLPMIEYVAKKRKPVILSTGMASIREVSEAVAMIRKTGNEKIALLQCTSAYPCQPENVNLLAMKTLGEKFGTIIGFSDHTRGMLAGQLAIAMGAKIIEKHFTLDRKMPGPDHKASLDPKELAEFVVCIRLAETILGYPEKRLSDTEKGAINAVRKSIHAEAFIPKGAIITMEMLSIKRPFAGLPPGRIDSVLGKKALRDIGKDQAITAGDFR